MSTLFLYYSYTGSGDIVANIFRENGADVRKVSPVNALPKSFFAGMMAGGFLATIGHKAKLKDWDGKVDGYDRVVIGSPIWNGRISCPINTVLSDLKGKDIPLAFVLYAGGGAAPKAVARLAKEYPGAPVILLKEPKKYPQETEKLQELFQ